MWRRGRCACGGGEGVHVEEGKVCMGRDIKHLLFLRPHTWHYTSAILYLLSRGLSIKTSGVIVLHDDTACFD